MPPPSQSSSGRRQFCLILVTFAVAIITYNVIISLIVTPFIPAAGSSDVLAADPVIEMPSHRRAAARPKRMFHTAMTTSDGVYNAWQARIMYYWFKKAKEKAGKDGEMGGFTRILHSGKRDKLMDEIPTFVVDPLPDGMDQGYVVLNRPWAFVQWLQKANIEEEYVFMAEPDHVIVKPIPNLARDGLAAAYPFFYIEPQKNEGIIRKFFHKDMGPITDVDPIGNSPVIISKPSLMKIAPTWMNISLAIKRDPVADKEFGWVQEMYAYAISSAMHGVGNILHKDFMIQPPYDTEIGDKYIIHYTYGCDFDMQGRATPGKFGEWRFDKRSYLSVPPPRNLTLPPKGTAQSVVTLVKMVKEASSNIPNWEDL